MSIIKIKIMGWLGIILTTLFLLERSFFTLVFMSFDRAEGRSINWFSEGAAIVPLSLFFVWLFYLSLRILRGQDLPIKKNNIVAYVLICAGIVYFIYNTAAFLDAGGGIIEPVEYFLEGALFVIFGLASRKKS